MSSAPDRDIARLVGYANQTIFMPVNFLLSSSVRGAPRPGVGGHRHLPVPTNVVCYNNTGDRLKTENASV